MANTIGTRQSDQATSGTAKEVKEIQEGAKTKTQKEWQMLSTDKSAKRGETTEEVTGSREQTN